MTPKMEAALLAARNADERGGLCYTAAGWIDPTACWTYHNFIVVSRLVWNHGYLTEAGSIRGKYARRVITEKGRAYLAEKERIKDRKKLLAQWRALSPPMKKALDGAAEGPLYRVSSGWQDRLNRIHRPTSVDALEARKLIAFDKKARGMRITKHGVAVFGSVGEPISFGDLS